MPKIKFVGRKLNQSEMLSLKKIVDYYFVDEKKHYEELVYDDCIKDKKIVDSHIFHHIERMKKFLKK